MAIIKTLLMMMMVVISAVDSMFGADMLEQVQVPEGTEVKLHCTHHGIPATQIFWLFETKAKIGKLKAYDPHLETDLKFFDGLNEGHLKFRRTDHILTIPCMIRSYEGLISCSQKSPRDLVELLMTFNLSTEHKANHDLSTKRLCDNDVLANSKPAIHMHTLSIIDHEGDGAILQCRAHGDPKPRIEWFDPRGHRVKFNQKGYQTFSNGDLLIRKLNWERDRGNYECVAINKFGKDGAEVFVYPAEKKRKMATF